MLLPSARMRSEGTVVGLSVCLSGPISETYANVGEVAKDY